MRWNKLLDHATKKEIIRLFERGLTRSQIAETTGWNDALCYQCWLNCRPGEPTPRQKRVEEAGKWL